MRYIPLCSLWMTISLLMAISCWAAESEPAVLYTLFDFEEGVKEWRANPWSGGTAYVEATREAKFGQGAFRAVYKDIPQGCNIISPYLPDEAPWREGDYDAIVFWLKGDGTPAYLHLYLASEIGDMSPTHSGQVPLNSTNWRRFCLPFDTLWNREGQPFVLRRLKRIYFGIWGGSHEVLIDHVQLQRPLRPVPLERIRQGGLWPLEPRLYADRQQHYFVTFDAASLPVPFVKAEWVTEWPQQPPAKMQRRIAVREATQETWLLLPGRPASVAGEGRLRLQLRAPTKTSGYVGDFRFPVAVEAPRREPTSLQLVPQPKVIIERPSQWRLPRTLEAYCAGQAPIARWGLEYAQRIFQEIYAGQIRLRTTSLQAPTPLLILTSAGRAHRVPAEILERRKELRPQGYVLHSETGQIALAASDEAGMRNGLLTLKQAILSVSPNAEEAGAPGLTIVDWPTLPIRAVNIGLPTTRWGYPNDAPVPVEFFMDFLQRTVVDLKFNVVGLEVLQGMKFDKHPEIAGPAAWSKAEGRRLVQFLRQQGIEVFPIVNSLGHANWLTIPRPQFQEEGDVQQLCTRHPEIRKVLSDVYDEVLEVFQPRLFHFGLDEIRWNANTPPEERCPRCGGLDRRQLFVEHVRWLAEYARSRKVQMMMWADMIIPEHNGGPPFFLAETLTQLPRDIVMCDWSVTLAPLSLWELKRRGYVVWKCNSRGCNNAERPYLAGNMWGIWSRTPWLTESCWRALGYAYLHQLMAAEYSWNAYPDLMARAVPFQPEFFQARPRAQWRLAQPALAGTGAQVKSLGPAGRTISVGSLSLTQWERAQQEARAFPVGEKASVIYALLSVELPEEQRQAFLEEFKKKEHWVGVPIGQIVLRYADGTENMLPIRYGYHVRAVPPEEPFPQAYGAMATLALDENARRTMAYLVAWRNPSLEKELLEARFVPGGLPAKPLLWGLAVRNLWHERAKEDKDTRAGGLERR